MKIITNHEFAEFIMSDGRKIDECVACGFPEDDHDYDPEWPAPVWREPSSGIESNWLERFALGE